MQLKYVLTSYIVLLISRRRPYAGDVDEYSICKEEKNDDIWGVETNTSVTLNEPGLNVNLTFTNTPSGVFKASQLSVVSPGAGQLILVRFLKSTWGYRRWLG